MEQLAKKLRPALLWLLGNEALFLFAAFLLRGTLMVDTFRWHYEAFSNLYAYILCPWGGALAALRLRRAQEKAGKEQILLFILLLWIAVPFLFRFGATFNNVTAIAGYLFVFFGIYASVSERPVSQRLSRLQILSLLFCVLALVWGGILLYCAFTGRTFGEPGVLPFGVRYNILYAGVHYNSVGMMALCTLFMSLAAIEVFRQFPLRALGFVSGLIMVLVIILTQSRTARYAMLLGLSLGCFGFVWHRGKGWKTLVLGLVLAGCTLVGGYVLCSLLTRMALAHYSALAGAKQGAFHVLFESALADTAKPRVAVDATLSERTDLWRNLFDLWRSDPRKMVIGRGVGNTGNLIAHDTSHASTGAAPVHNAFLQIAADFGLIGLLLQILFLVFALWNGIRAFLQEVRRPGVLCMCMMVIALLATAMMESAPLGQMTPTCMCLYFALAYLRMPEGGAQS